jgi:adenosylcobinamide-GDP ribazoletransferase
MRALWVSVQFLTRLPVPGAARPAEPAMLRRAALLFPLVGAGIGLATAAMVWAASRVWPLPVAVVLALAGEALLTGALHEDAVADSCDAFGGGRTREDILRILKDSRVGSFGALGLTLAVLLRAATVAALPAALLVPAVVASASLGRWLMLPLMALLPPPADHSSLARDLGSRLGARGVLVGGVLTLPGIAALAIADPWRCAAGVLGCLVALLAAWRYFARRLGGATGDCLGALCYAGQLVVLLACAGRIP